MQQYCFEILMLRSHELDVSLRLRRYKILFASASEAGADYKPQAPVPWVQARPHTNWVSSKTFPSWDNTVAKRLNLTQTKAASELKLLILTIGAAQSTMSSETEDTDQPTILPILRISSHQGTKQQRRDSKKEIKGKIFMYFIAIRANIYF